MNVLQEAQDAARETLPSDPELLRPEHTQLKAAVARLVHPKRRYTKLKKTAGRRSLLLCS